MAGRRLSSNDVSVVIALAIVLLVLLLIFAVERRAEPREDPQAAAALRGRAESTASAVSVSGAPAGEAGVAVSGDGCTAVAARLLAGSPDDGSAARQRDDALAAILAVLDAHSQPRARAAGLYFRAARDRLASGLAEICRERADGCSTGEQSHPEDRGSVEALARLAVESADPQVYAWAYRSCAWAARDVAGSCQLINALQWARLDPGNAEPWFAVAREARTRRDGAGVDDAMFHVATASVDDAGWGRLVQAMVDAAPPDDSLLLGTWLASADARTYESLDVSPPDVSRYCDQRAIANANRRDTCEKMATVLVDRSTTLAGRAVGVALAKRLDWPPARLAAIDEEDNAARFVESREALAWTASPGCADARRDLSRRAEVGRLGELEALRQRVARTGEPIAMLAEEGRRRARGAEVAAGAGAAGSAPPAATSAIAPIPASEPTADGGR